MRVSVLSFPQLLMGYGMRRAEVAATGNPAAGVEHLSRFGSGSCRTLPRILGVHGQASPGLADVAGSGYVAGRASQSTARPGALDSASACVSSGYSDARVGHDGRGVPGIAAYLYSLNQESI